MTKYFLLQTLSSTTSSTWAYIYLTLSSLRPSCTPPSLQDPGLPGLSFPIHLSEIRALQVHLSSYHHSIRSPSSSVSSSTILSFDQPRFLSVNHPLPMIHWTLLHYLIFPSLSSILVDPLPLRLVPNSSLPPQAFGEADSRFCVSIRRMVARRNLPPFTKHSSILNFLQGDAELEQHSGDVEGPSTTVRSMRIGN